ncbi:butyrophilin subfamily 1 member A1-like [Salmo salar]|uniref:Butyrophilin subfamily 1 member A1-like n=1 Tax=Salmo salar TaxID=8030 RepID=A0ABM3E9L9_SALSA|nr:butyrophilin subfamily 1 member A1-like [Salmo salar]
MERTCPLLLLLSTLVYCSLGQSGAGIYDEDSFGSSGVQVVGPADQVVALAGDDIILPCSLKPSVNAEDMVVEWTRSNLRKENVHLYSDGRDSNVEQVPSYSGRTSMFNEELKNGNVSLKLTRVTLSDAGSYMCFIPTLTSQVKETTVQLFVGAVSQPVISIDGTKGWGVVLKCESGGWFPEPEMEWLDSSGTILPADGPPERHRDSECLYSVRRHVTVDQTDTNRFTCRVHQKEINHLKETEIHVPNDVFPKSHVGLIVGLIAADVAFLAASAISFYMWIKYTEDDVFPKSQVGLIVGLLIAAAVGVIAALVGVYMLSKHNEDDVFPKLQLGLIVGLLLAAVGLLAASAGVFGVYMWRKHTEGIYYFTILLYYTAQKNKGNT